MIKLANIAALLIPNSLVRCVNTESKRIVEHIIFNQKETRKSDSGSGAMPHLKDLGRITHP